MDERPASRYELQKEHIHALHTALSSRRNTLDQLLWQVPTISLTAQAFLLAIAFASDRSDFYRKFAGLVASGIAFISWQLFLRHAELETQAAKELAHLEDRYFGKTVHERPGCGCWPSQWRSRWIWKTALFVLIFPGFGPWLESVFGYTNLLSKLGH